MKTIWKFPFEVTNVDGIEMPQGAKILHVGVQGGLPCIWALVEKDATWPKVKRLIRVRGTGHDIPVGDSLLHVGTYQHGPYVWHVFDRGEA